MYFKEFKHVCLLVMMFFLLLSFSSGAVIDSKPSIVCEKDISASNQSKCSIGTSEKLKESVNIMEWAVSGANLENKTDNSIEIDSLKSGKVILEARVSIEGEEYNLSRSYLINNSKLGSYNDKNESKRNESTEKRVDLGNFTDKKNGSNIGNKDGDRAKRSNEKIYNLTRVNIKCPDKVNTSEEFLCNAELIKNDSLGVDSEWESEEAELIDGESFRAEFKAENPKTVLIVYKLNISGREIVSTDKVVVENPKAVKPPVEAPDREQKLEELNRTIEEKNNTINKLRSEIQQLEEELNSSKPKDTIDSPDNKSDGDKQNSLDGNDAISLPGNTTGRNQSQESEPTHDENNSIDQSPGRKNENIQSGRTIFDIISSIFS